MCKCVGVLGYTMHHIFEPLWAVEAVVAVVLGVLDSIGACLFFGTRGAGIMCPLPVRLWTGGSLALSTALDFLKGFGGFTN